MEAPPIVFQDNNRYEAVKRYYDTSMTQPRIYCNSYDESMKYLVLVSVMLAYSLDDLLDGIEIGKFDQHVRTIAIGAKHDAITKLCDDLGFLAFCVYWKHAFSPEKEDRREDLLKLQAKCKEVIEALRQ
jgi:hypothetical protein